MRARTREIAERCSTCASGVDGTRLYKSVFRIAVVDGTIRVSSQALRVQTLVCVVAADAS